MLDLATLTHAQLIDEVARLRAQVAHLTSAAIGAAPPGPTDHAALRASGVAAEPPTVKLTAHIEAALLHTVIDTAQVGLALVDAGHRYRYANQAYKQMLRLPPDDLTGRFVGDVLGPLYEQLVRPRLECAFRGERVSYHIALPPLPGEEQRFYTVRLELGGDPADPIVVVVGLDITELERAEASLHEREIQLRLANEAANIGTWRYDMRANSIRFDARGRAHYGLTESQVTLEEILARTHPADLPQVEQAISAAIQPDSAGHHSVEYRVVHPDGSIHWLVAQAQVYFEGEGEARCAVLGFGTSQDITAQKDAEESLRQSTERLRTQHVIDRAILEARSPEQVATMAIEHLRRLVPYHRATVLLYDAERQCMQTLAVSGDIPAPPALGDQIALEDSDLATDLWVRHPWFVDDAQAAPHLAPIAPMLARLDVRSLIHIPLLIQETLIGTLSLSAPTVGAFDERHLTIAAEVVDQLAVAIQNARLLAQLQHERADLARRVVERTAELSAANTELARAARLKDEFLANMSHELRTPLNAILGRAEILGEQIYGPLTLQQRQSILSIEESGQHLLSLINDILDLAKIESGRITLDPQPIPIDEICRASLRMVAQAAMQKRQTLTSSLDGTVDIVVADVRRLKQMLVNLLSNAVKFTPEGGEIGLEVQAHPEHESVTLTVWDTGIGIAPEDQARLFQAFVQIDSDLSRQSAGTGLGLALVMRLARLHGGSVTLESVPGVGSRFSISLPWAAPAPPEAAAPSALAEAQVEQPAGHRPLLAAALQPAGATLAAPPAQRPLLLLADDNEANVGILADYLLMTGYEVAVAHDGLEAVDRAEALRPALILMDIQMPNLDGLEAIRRIRAAGLRDTPIIALTALAMPGDRERCLEAGASAYMPKPASLRSVGQVIADQLRGAP